MSILSDILSERSVLQLARLAAKSGLEFDRLQQLAAGAEASLGELRRLSGPLHLPINDLLPPSPAVEKTELLFRRSLSPGAKLPPAAGMLARQMSSSLSLATEFHRDLAWRGAFSPAQNSVGHAEANASIFRSLFYGDDQLSPITRLPHIVGDRMGVNLYVISSTEVDGASAILDGQAFTFVSARFPPRMLFTLAHEVGHLVAHHGNDPFAILDEDIESAPTGPNREIEAYANTFASALLMPRESVGLALKTIRRTIKAQSDKIGDVEINYLARIYGLSFWAAARRCEDLELLPVGGAHALNAKLVADHGSAEQRAEQLGLPPRAEIVFPKVPSQLMDAAIANIKAGEISIGRAANSLGVSLADLISANAPTRH